MVSVLAPFQSVSSTVSLQSRPTAPQVHVNRWSSMRKRLTQTTNVNLLGYCYRSCINSRNLIWRGDEAVLIIVQIHLSVMQRIHVVGTELPTHRSSWFVVKGSKINVHVNIHFTILHCCKGLMKISRPLTLYYVTDCRK